MLPKLTTLKGKIMDSATDYLKRRVDHQASWHSEKAGWNKHWFYGMEIATLASGAIIPIINLAADSVLSATWRGLISAILAIIVVLAAGISKLFKFQENWLNYRALAEVLKREKELYLNGVGEYNLPTEPEKNKVLVSRVEDVLASTTSQFMALNRSDREQSKKDQK